MRSDGCGEEKLLTRLTEKLSRVNLEYRKGVSSKFQVTIRNNCDE